MPDPVVKPEDDATDELAAALDRSPKAPEPEPEPEPEPAPVKKEEVKAEEKPPAEPEPKDDLFTPEEQNRELRQILRQQKREMAVMQSKLNRLERRSVAATKQVEKEVNEEEALFGKPAEKAAETKTKEATPEEELTPVESLQYELATLARVKGPVLETLLETMELNPKFEDVRTVCSQANFDDIFEAIGDSVAKSEGKDPAIAALEAEAAVWKMPNPYKYMYELIKKFHPKYAGRQPAKTDATPEKKKEPAKAPTSLANVPGTGKSTGAWTAARIDELDEMELGQVPADIYEKYLRGELD